MTKGDDSSYNIFYKDELFPEPQAIFSWKPKSLKSIKSNCIVVLDTNVLLIPYTVSSQSLEKIRSVYSELQRLNRLIVPAQVAREFASNRFQKIGELSQKIFDTSSTAKIPQFSKYPLLESVDEFSEVLKIQEELGMYQAQLTSAVKKVIDRVNDWTWDDPVSLLYSEVFSHAVLDPELDPQIMQEDLKHRTTHKIPPGYKDAGKDDGGIGDVLIWNTILKIGKTQTKHLLFVSSEEKSDWWHKSSNRTLCPRTELVEEYRRASSGKTFHMLSLAALLELFEAEPDVVTEVRAQEAHQTQLDSDIDLTWRDSPDRHIDLEWMFTERVKMCMGEANVRPAPSHYPGVDADLLVSVGRKKGDVVLVEMRTIHDPQSLPMLDISHYVLKAKMARSTFQSHTNRNVRSMLVLLIDDISSQMESTWIKKLTDELNLDRDYWGRDISVHAYTPEQVLDMTCGQIHQMFSVY